ncbi:hypothetical protein J8F10_30295 [Gemmata sp. G18]|uniref:Periplasmic heavy metal sensor n=1 Tax=Gemmata palustris TaxID=2822762 RepID=A0ABS5C0Q9_9BACT|nr:hypothetical protein [Gemmata palustris]MBP3959556.1 hypothetical protein [Gemmata palustris]
MFATLTARPRLLATALVLAAFTGLAGHPTLAESVGADVWNVAELQESLRESTDVSSQLDTEGGAVLRRIAVKEALVDELLAGRAPLAEVTTKFTELNAARAEYLTTIRAFYPGATDQEKMARNVISFALLRAPARARSALAQRLDAELNQMIAPSGTH